MQLNPQLGLSGLICELGMLTPALRIKQMNARLCAVLLYHCYFLPLRWLKTSMHQNYLKLLKDRLLGPVPK